MISLQKGFLFIHVPKTGGNSIQNILRDYSEDKVVTVKATQDGLERFEVRNDKYEIRKHSTLSEYKSVLEPEVFRSLFKFATIRNPWEMVISFYFTPGKGVSTWDRAKFIELISKARTLRDYITFAPQKPDATTEAAAQPLDAELDYLMRFESLQDDFNAVCGRLDIPPVELPFRNRSVRDHYSKYYDDDLKELVRAKFHEEIEHVGYEFGAV